MAIIDPHPGIGDALCVPQSGTLSAVDMDLDGVIVATPTALHAQNALEAVSRGLPAMVEKPVTSTAEEAAALTEVSQKAGVPILVAHHRRHHAKVARLRALLDSGRLGKVVSVSALWHMRKPADYFDAEWRAGSAGSPVLINLVHDLDLMRFLFGEIDMIAGAGRAVHRKEDRVESGGLVVSFKDGPVATMTFGDMTPSPWGFEAGTGENPNIAATGQDMMWIMGTDAAASFPSLTVWSGTPDWVTAPFAERMGGATKDEQTPPARQLDHFCDVITGVAQPLCSPLDGMASLQAALEAETCLARSAGVTPPQ